mmetsp:Transcript_86634/g.166756  ORF Transcript_86634/g.166756 Transcript_86634/m.166756 type:complete len:82 (+) Transcript_86634:1668-1913(+)
MAPSIIAVPQPPATTHRETSKSTELKKLLSLEDLDDLPDDDNAVGRQAFPSFGLQAKGQGNRNAGLLGTGRALDRTIDCRF